MKSFLNNFAIIVFFLLCACSAVKDDLLLGQWEAFEVLEEGEPLGVDPAEINITFGPGENYVYKSTLNYLEAGNYYLDSKYLITLDTVNKASSEKAVEILKLTTDSLFLRMNEGAKERILKLKKLEK